VARDDPGIGAVTTPLALAVEVLSPSSRSVDLVLKRELYEQARVAAYWVVDPTAASLRAWVLRDDDYVEQEVVLDGQRPVQAPFPVAIEPSDLFG
jgi:Uma2 family endonuclease